MSKKMWNRIFKTKSTNKTPGISKKSSIPAVPITINSAVENRLSYYEEFHNCCQQQPPIKAKASRKQAAQDSPVKTPSKFSKVVNTFTLKRNSKENQSNQLNTTSTTTTTGTTAVETTTSAGSENEKNYSTQGNVGGPIMDKIGTPTATIFNQSDNTIAESEDPVSLELIPCPTCSRTFVPRTLEKHVRICEKMNVKKRKIFDSSRQRREGTELAAYPLPKNFGLPPSKAERGLSPKPMQAPPPISSPRKPPEEMIKSNLPTKSRNPVASKKPPSPSPVGTPTGHSTSAPRERSTATAARVAPKRIQAPAAEQCPYCERCFGIKAYDRHVEWCKEKSLIASIKQNSNNTQVAAKGRLEARTKYRAPCLKTKRSVNRDKYSCHTDENVDMQTSMEEYNQKTSTMTSSMTSSFMSDGTKSPKGIYPPKKTANTSLKKMPQPTHLEDGKPTVSSLNKTTVKTSLRRKRVEVFKSASTDSMGSAITTTQMSDGDLEQLFEKEFEANTAPMGIKMHADTQAPKLDLKKEPTRRNKIDVSQASVHSKNSQSNRRRLIKERIEFFNSSPSASSSTSCQTGRVAPNEQVPGRLPTNKSFIVSGLSDNYDPFLSAKRQLEELCSPSSPTDGVFSPPNLTATSKTPTKPSTPIIPNKMSTSLTSTTSLTNPRRVLTTVKSNFRRTSSLRAPRRSPLPMPSRPIFFPSTQKQRPTIQRGLSDEGPISSNFLKPEEYDEMPVRAVCVNDFAISNPQRVIRRDSNAAANRKNLRLQLPGGTGQQSNKDGTPTPPVGRANNNLLKTDSLAVFLKYENEAKAAENPVIYSKELKDKSNTLSKQNSNKSVLLDEQPENDRSEDIRQRAETLHNTGGNMNTIKLEPIVRPIPFNQAGLVQPAKRQSPTTLVAPVVSKPINLNLILDGRDHLGGAADCDYIDPKLINVCDNLSMDFGNDLPLSSNSSSSDGDRVDNETEKIDHAENSANLSSSSNSCPSPCTFKRATSPAPQIKLSPAITSNRNSGGDSRNLLKRKIRLGRNQFLYDASPENEPLDNDADDEGNNNRSPCEPNRFQISQQTMLFPPTSNTSTTATPNANIPNIPLFSPSTFDEFDFEEFLSSFDNDDEQFPSLFKDCREFLMNRSTLNKRSNTDKMSSYRSSNEKLNNSARKYEEDVEQNLNCGENKKRGEIFISIETDQNENDPHPKNDPLVAANPTAHIEEVDVNDNKFLKIQDDDVDVDVDEDEDDDDEVEHRSGSHVGGEESEDRLRMRRIDLLNDFPNVRLNNAKNLIQQMHEDFQDLNATREADAEDEINGNCVRQITGSSLYPVDSDEISSVECYPVRGTGSGGVRGGGGRAVQSKHSADSAYGSLSRQSPTGEIHPHHRGSNISARTPATPQESPQMSPFQYPQNPTHKYSNTNRNDSQKFRSRNFSVGSSSSGSENSLPPIKGNRNIPNLHQDAQSQMRDLKRTVHRSPMQSSALENKQLHNTSSRTNSSSTNILDRPSTPTSPSVKTSKFCHECGSRFLLDQAKFCMDCGVRRIVLK